MQRAPAIGNGFERLSQEASISLSSPPSNYRPTRSADAFAPIRFSSQRSIAEHLQAPESKGRFYSVQRASDSTSPSLSPEKLQQGEIPKISVVYADKSAQQSSRQADFIIKADGKIEVFNDPEKNPVRNIVIQVERESEQSPLSENQQKSVDDLAKYLTERLSQNAEYAKLSGGKVEIDDQHKLISDATQKDLSQKSEPELPIPPPPNPTQDVPSLGPDSGGIGNGINSGGYGGDGGSSNYGNGGSPNYGDGGGPYGGDGIGPGGTPTKIELPPVQAMKETLAAMFQPDEQEPYKTVRKSYDGYRVGRYGLSGRNTGNWFSSLLFMDPELAEILGDPPDYSKLEAYLKKHPEKAKALKAKMAAAAKQSMQQLAGKDKLPKDFAAKFDDPAFAEGFADFIGQLGDPNSSQDEIKNGMEQFMPKKLQETISQQLIEHYAGEITGDKNPKNLSQEDAGKVGLALALGRVPSERDSQFSNYRDYSKAVQEYYSLARDGRFGFGDVDVSEFNQRLVDISRSNVGVPLWARSPWANVVEGGNLGCAASVSMVLKQMGIPVPGSAGVVELSRQLRSVGYQQIPIGSVSQYRPGDIVFGATGSGSGGNGHIGIIGEVGNGQALVYENSSSSGRWTRNTVQSSGSFVPGQRFGQGELFVLRKQEA